MHIIPAVDIRNGKAVRLLRGEKDRETVYSDSPADMARRWADEGATYLHVVDLDGAFDGASENEPHIRDIARAVAIPVEVGGGVRTVEKARRLIDMGVARVIVGTKALESRDFVDELLALLPGRVHIGVDARDGMVAIKGWTETSGTRATDFLAGFSGSGVGAIIYTDISRDGALEGVNAEAMRDACSATDVPIIASGGVASADDILKLRGLPLFGIIVGKALYEGRLTLREAMAAL
jgi:phosphoribosylformimino-5-aminoimidazole carboxamide ribotide isomerase